MNIHYFIERRRKIKHSTNKYNTNCKTEKQFILFLLSLNKKKCWFISIEIHELLQ